MSRSLSVVCAVIVGPLALVWSSARGGPDCGELPAGRNPEPSLIAAAIEECSGRHGVPTEIIKGVAFQESGVQQWRSNGRLVINPVDCGFGMMQLTGSTAASFDIDRLKRDWRYNLDAGVTVLRRKWDRAERNGLVPASDPAARRVLENWYYAVAFYQGGRNEVYLTKIFTHIEKRPGVLARILKRSVRILRPGEIMEVFKFGDRFLARPGGVWEASDGTLLKGLVHLGTIGDESTLAQLDGMLARARRAQDRRRWSDAIRYYQALLQADRDTEHRPEAESQLAEIRTLAASQLAEVRSLAGQPEASAMAGRLRRFIRTFKGLPEAEEAAGLLDELRQND